MSLSLAPHSLEQIVIDLRNQLKTKGENSVRRLKYTARSFPSHVDRDQLEAWLTSSGLFLSSQDYSYLIRTLGSSDGLSVESLLTQLVPPLTGRRLRIVEKLFKMLDNANLGRVSLGALYQKYDSSKHLEVTICARSAEEVTNRFLDAFGATEKGENGWLSKAEFMESWTDISASYPFNDSAFVQMIERVFSCAEEVPNDASEILGRQLRDKLRMKMKETEQEELVLLKAFKFVDIYQTGHLTKPQFLNALARLGVNVVDPTAALELFDAYDRDQLGSIDYAVFARDFLGADPGRLSRSLMHSLF
jgi:Ca2+-binding EF-hand superfamily protein